MIPLPPLNSPSPPEFGVKRIVLELQDTHVIISTSVILVLVMWECFPGSMTVSSGTVSSCYSLVKADRIIAKYYIIHAAQLAHH